MRRLAVGVVVASVAVTSAGAAPAPKFAAPRLVETITDVGGVSELATGDLNGDSLADAVVARLEFRSDKTFPIGVLLADGSGGFADATASIFVGAPPRTQHGRRIVIADFNGDRRNDILVADHGQDAEPFAGFWNTLALSTADGKLIDASDRLPHRRGFHHSAAAADVDRDGDIDLFDGDLGGENSILVNDGTGRFVSDHSRLAENTRLPIVMCLFGDIEGDGDPDLVVGTDQFADRSYVLLNDGSGRFAQRLPLPPKPFGPTAIAISLASIDVNGDRAVDLLVGHTKSAPFYSGRWVQLLVNDGSGRFSDETRSRLPEQADNALAWPLDFRVTDLDRDGDPDFGVSTAWAPGTTPPVFVNRGDGTFDELPGGIPGTEALFAFVDPNGDGRPDVLMSVGGESERHYVIRQLAPPPAAPRGIRASRGVYADRVRITWRPAADALRYEVWRSLGNRQQRIVTTTATRHDDRAAKRGPKYAYRVVAVGADGKSAPSARALGWRRS